MDLIEMIVARDEWVARNFPDPTGENTPGDSIIGCIEELGELAHSHLKLKQGIRGTPQEHLDAARDALGDLMIYLMGVISYHGEEDLREFVAIMVRQDSLHLEILGAEDCLFRLAKAVGNLADAHERVSTILWPERCGEVMHFANQYALTRSWDLSRITGETWAKVSQRDWIADPQGGGE